MSVNLDDIFNQLLSLSDKDKEKLMQMLQNTTNGENLKLEKELKNERFKNGRVCPYCGETHIVKNGHRKDNIQKFICRECKKSFVLSTKSVFSRTKKEYSVWKKYIECLIDGCVLRVAAEECKISIKTAFYWRHKILGTLSSMANRVKLGEIVESDETFFEESFKGKHGTNTPKLNRKAHKRGSNAKKRGISNEKICVECAVNRKGLSLAKVTNRGRIRAQEIEEFFKGHLDENIVLCTDKHFSYRKFVEGKNISLVQIDSKERIKGAFTIQHINSFHSILKKFMIRFCGVATKHLNNYLMWNNIRNEAKGNKNEKSNILRKHILQEMMNITNKEIILKDPEPFLYKDQS